MKQCTETITVLNRRYNPATGLDDWIPTVIHGASWHSSIKANITNDGLKAADTATVRIPVGADTGGRTYMAPASYKAAGNVSGTYPLAEGDLIVRGTVSGQNLTPAQIQEANDDCYTIIGLTDNTRRPRGAHWKVVGA